MAAVAAHFFLDSVFDLFDCAVQEFSIRSHILHQSIHRLDELFNDLFETVVTPVITILDAVSHIHCVHALVFTSDFDVLHNLSEELPCDLKVFRSLRTGSNHKIANRLILQHIDSHPCIDVLVFGVRYSSKVRLKVPDNKFLLLLLLFVLNNWFILFSKLEPIFFKVYVWVNSLYNCWEAGNHTVMTHVLVPIDIVLMRQI